MGLESHIRNVIENEPASGLIFGTHYWFENGLIVPEEEDAEKLIELLDESGEFGPARCVPIKGEKGRLPLNRIEFGVHESFFKDKPFDEWVAYCNAFWSGEED